MPKIETMFAYIAEDDEGEGVTGMKTPEGWIAMVGADPERMESLQETAQMISRTSGKVITLARFSVREDLEVIKPDA